MVLNSELEDRGPSLQFASRARLAPSSSKQNSALEEIYLAKLARDARSKHHHVSPPFQGRVWVGSTNREPKTVNRYRFFGLLLVRVLSSSHYRRTGSFVWLDISILLASKSNKIPNNF